MSKLPTIQPLVSMFKEHMSQLDVRHRMPYDYPIKGDDLYLLNRTASGLFTLKPNITNQPCLFYGSNTIHGRVIPKWNELKSSDYIVQNVLREEFELVMESHPLFSLLKNGIMTPKGLFRMINPYGIAMAYGFPSPMIPLTSSLDAAAFYATHYRTPLGSWEPIPATDKDGNTQYGILFFLYMAQPFPYMVGLSTVGMQAFKRSGNQKLFGLQMPQGTDLGSHPMVSGYIFRHNPEEAAQYTHLQDMLMPKEIIADKAEEILSSKIVSEAAFIRNCRNNPTENAATNRRRLNEAGIEISGSISHVFTQEELASYYDNAAEEWGDMLNHIVALHPGFDKILNSLRDYDFTSYIEKNRQR